MFPLNFTRSPLANQHLLVVLEAWQVVKEQLRPI